MAKDFYTVLGVKKNATQDEINESYRRLALKYHPDRNQEESAADKFKEAAEAYDTLGDEQKRSMYDRTGTAGPFQSSSGFGGFGFDVGDIFNQAFNRARPDNSALHMRVQIDLLLKEASTGCKKDVPIKRRKWCKDCSGTGVGEWTKCQNCDGSGRMHVMQGPFSMSTTCQACQGRGQISTTKCKPCSGKGFTGFELDTVSAKIIPGVDNNQTLRLGGLGEKKDGKVGDLFVVVRLLSHPLLVRHGMDLVCEVPVNYSQLVLGDKIEVPTIESVAEVVIPEGTDAGSKFRLKGQGMPDIRNPSFRGDIIAIVQSEVPKDVSKKHKKALQQLLNIEKSLESEKRKSYNRTIINQKNSIKEGHHGSKRTSKE